MNYEIAYISRSGNTKMLAHSIARRLPNNTIITDLSHATITSSADLYLLGFGVNKGTIPLCIMDTLEQLHNTKLMFFITSGMEPVAEYKNMFERRLQPFISEDCDYRGIFMCQGKFPDEVINFAQLKLSEDPQNPTAIKILQDSELSAEHPNEIDFENAYHFIKDHI